MTRLGPNTRIRPVRPYWSRPKMVTVATLVGIGLFWVGTAWLQSSGQETVELDPGGPYRIRSTAGPIEVTNSEAAVLDYRASWLLFGPSARPPTDQQELFELDCATRFPCRAAAVVALPAAAVLEVEAVDEDLSVTGFDGTIDAATVGRGDVLLARVRGRAGVSTERGGVFGHGLSLSDLSVESQSGEIVLHFADRPRRVSVKSGSEPVTIELPDGDYAVSVKSGSSVAVNVGQVATADSEILVQARGPVRIDPSR